MKKNDNAYHHGNLAESLLAAVDETATRFGLEAVTLRGCAKLVGVSPSAAFRHYADKRTLLTAFATRALDQLTESMACAARDAEPDQAFAAVGLAYIAFAIEKPAYFRVMWREEAIYTADPDYAAAAARMSARLQAGFADSLSDADPHSLSTQELLAWSSVHGLACLLIDGPVGAEQDSGQKLASARQMITALAPALSATEPGI